MGELPKVLGKPKVFIDVPAESQMCNFWLAVGTQRARWGSERSLCVKGTSVHVPVSSLHFCRLPVVAWRPSRLVWNISMQTERGPVLREKDRWR